MKHARFWQIVFCGKGIWNCVASVLFFFFEDALRDRLGVPHADPTYQAMFLSLAFIFGLGYWRVGRDLSTNRDIVWAGVLGQTAVPVIVAYEVFVSGDLPPLYLVPGGVDLVCAILFAVFLVRTK